jgi:hypothetical protein
MRQNQCCSCSGSALWHCSARIEVWGLDAFNHKCFLLLFPFLVPSTISVAPAISSSFHRSAAEIFSCYIGEAEAIVRSLFARARACAPCVLFIDEVDALVGARSFGSCRESGGDVVQGRVLASFLTEMDGIGTGDGGVVLVGATNRLEVCLSQHHPYLLYHKSTPNPPCCIVQLYFSHASVHRCCTPAAWSL